MLLAVEYKWTNAIIYYIIESEMFELTNFSSLKLSFDERKTLRLDFSDFNDFRIFEFLNMENVRPAIIIQPQNIQSQKYVF